MTQASTYRRQLWPSRQAAVQAFKRSPFYGSWDPRVLDRFVNYGLRPLPTLLHPSKQDNDDVVTLVTPPDQEVFTFSRPIYNNKNNNNKLIRDDEYPDIDPAHPTALIPLYRPENQLIFYALPYIRPSVFFVFGSLSPVSSRELNEEKVRSTGTGVGGNGGVAAGRVGHVTLQGISHDCAKESPSRCADAMSDWLISESRRWRDQDEAFRAMWSKKSIVEKSTVDEQWKKLLPPPERPAKKNTGGKL